VVLFCWQWKIKIGAAAKIPAWQFPKEGSEEEIRQEQAGDHHADFEQPGIQAGGLCVE
jgi:hypothetical protein